MRLVTHSANEILLKNRRHAPNILASIRRQLWVGRPGRGGMGPWPHRAPGLPGGARIFDVYVPSLVGFVFKKLIKVFGAILKYQSGVV